jgi:hypothetical protein
MPQILTVAVDLAQITCGCCGGVYAINERVRAYHEEHSTSWHCPYCQVGWGFHGKGPLAEAKQKITALEAKVRDEAERHARTLSRLNAETKVSTRLAAKIKRCEKGACPHCNRVFTNLARHMATKHVGATTPGVLP